MHANKMKLSTSGLPPLPAIYNHLIKKICSGSAAHCRIHEQP